MASAGAKEPAYYEAHIAHNNRVLQHLQTLVCAAAGSAAGIVGLTSVAGFAFYAASWAVLVGLLWALKAQGSPRQYFVSPWGMATHGVLGSLFSYVLFWTLAFGLVHVYD
ncbi:hypothetical protein H4R35_004159 [Dimargaris xerosporica]|nr:hypothetical protein H4R35_004159 [Dimargaris xerosporica]